MIALLRLLSVACISTILLEAVPVLLFKEKKAWFKAGVACNVATNPVLNAMVMLITFYIGWGKLAYGLVLLLEVAVVFLEAWFYRFLLDKTYGCCLLFSACANALSFCTGLILSG